MISDFSELISKWPNMNELAGDLDEKPDTVRKWKQRNSIPADRWRSLISAAQHRGISVDEVDLVRIADAA